MLHSTPLAPVDQTQVVQPFVQRVTEGTVEVAPKTKSGRAKLHAELVALAKIRGDKAGDKKVSKTNDGGLTECHAGATSSQGAR